MWQIICVCLSIMNAREQQHFFHLLCGAEHACAEKRGAVDLGLSFLHALSAEEALTVLEERRALVVYAFEGKTSHGAQSMNTTRKRQEHFIPALSYHFLTPVYDPVMRTLLRETRFKRHVLALAEIESGQRVLDVGCGTATVALLLKQQHPETTVVGLDADPQALKLARRKLTQARLQVTLAEGTVTALPYSDGSFDRILSSLLFHHLTEEQTVQAAREVFRVLKAGGSFVVADWGKAANRWMRFAFVGVQLLDGFTTTKNVAGALPELFTQAGFVQVRPRASYATLFGTLTLYQAKKA